MKKIILSAFFIYLCIVNLQALYMDLYLDTPEDNETRVSLNPTLLWRSRDLNTFDVFFGTSSYPSCVAIDISGDRYSLKDLQPGTIYYWKIRGKNGDNIMISNTYSFSTGELPKVNLISPSHGSNSVPMIFDLEWEATEASSFELYFGTSENPSCVLSDYTKTSYETKKLHPGTRYCWYVIAKNEFGDKKSDKWYFTTRESPSIELDLPSDLAIIKTLTPALQWTAKHAISYDVYYGISSNPPLMDKGVESSSYQTDKLQPKTRYYWKIVANNENGDCTTSSIRSFITSVDAE